MSVLIVDDNPANVMLLTHILEDHYDIVPASSGEEALREVKKHTVETIILDVQMPGMDGFTVLEELKNDPRTADIPTIMLTAQCLKTSEIVAGLQRGAFDYLTKPIDNELIKLRVCGAVKHFINLMELKCNQQRTQAMISAMNDCVITFDKHGNIESINDAVEKTFGFTAEDLIGSSFLDLFDQEYQDNVISHFDLCIQTGKNQTLGVHKQGYGICKDGSQFPLYMTISEIKTDISTDQPGQSYIACITDVTERVKQENALRRSQKMQSIGELVGGIAHDFNNILGIIMGNLELVECNPNSEKTEKWIKSSINAAERAATLTRRMLQFSRQEPSTASPICVNNVITDISELIQRSLTSKIDMQLELAEDIWTINIDPRDLEDMLVNLSLNVRDAMPENRRGLYIIKTYNYSTNKSVAGQTNDFGSGNYVAIEFTDNASGMDDTTLEHIFEPFYTTKDIGKGTGLGMSMVYGFVKRSSGHIEIESTLGEGTKILVYFPRCEQTQQRVPERKRSLPKASLHHETILVVDDQIDLLEITCTHLSELGYHTLTAESGEQALDILNSAEKIDLLFSDVVMPGGISGHELYEHAQKIRPDLKVLLTTGFEFKAQPKNNLANDIKVLSKPYRMDELANQVSHFFS